MVRARVRVRARARARVRVRVRGARAEHPAFPMRLIQRCSSRRPTCLRIK